MYESPVDVVYNQMRTEVDNHIFKAIVDVGVNVNKEELIKALQYDRGQYDKGYKDGYEDGLHDETEVAKLREICSYQKGEIQRLNFEISRRYTRQELNQRIFFHRNKAIKEFSNKIIDFVVKSLGKSRNILSNHIVLFIQSTAEELTRKGDSNAQNN